jgi:hypothetical protein
MEILDSKIHLKEDPPRKISFLANIKVLFDGYAVEIGASVLGIGLILTQLFVGQSKFMEIVDLNGDWVETSGRLVEHSIYGRDRMEDLYIYHFEFTVEDEFYEGTCTGTFLRGGMREECLIEYRSLNPNRSRIVGTGGELYTSLVACFLFLPLLGLVFILIGLKNNYKTLFLLKYGILSQGKTQSAKKVAALGGGIAHEFVFEFKVEGKSYEASCVTKKKERVEDDALYNILYDTDNPNKNIVYDALGHIPETGKLAAIKQENPISVFYWGLTFVTFIINMVIYCLWYW